MPSISKPHTGKKTTTRSRRKPCSPDQLAPAKRKPRRAAPPSGSVTQGTTIKLLQEVADMLQGRAAVYEHHRLAVGDAEVPLGAEKLRGLADEDLTHSAWLAERITELGGSKEAKSRHKDSAAKQDVGSDAKSLLNAEMALEDAVVDRFGRILTLVGESDLTTKFLIEDILFDEREHAEERHS